MFTVVRAAIQFTIYDCRFTNFAKIILPHGVAAVSKQVTIDILRNKVKGNSLMKNLLIAGFAVIALTVLAALPSVNSTQSPVAGCGGCTNGVIATYSCGGSCTNQVQACGGCTNGVTGLLVLR